MKKLKLAVLGSTQGTDLLALLATKELEASIDLVVSNKSNAGILEKAQANGIKTIFLDQHVMTRDEFDEKLSEVLQAHSIDRVVLIGYMRILTPKFVVEWQNKIINVHPSLLPAFAGGMNMNVHAEVLKAGLTETGCTVHIVTEEIDAGPILLQKRCEVLSNDTVETLKARVQQLEGKALIEVINQIASHTSGY